MTVLTKRAGDAAREILDKRDPYGSEPLDHDFIRLLLAEAYSIGYREGKQNRE